VKKKLFKVKKYERLPGLTSLKSWQSFKAQWFLLLKKVRWF